MAYVKAIGLGAVAAMALASAASAEGLGGSVRARVTYDSSAARSSDALAQARGLKQEDVIGDILATFDVTRKVGRQDAFVRGSVGYDFHKNNSQLDRERINVSAGVSRKVGPCETSFTGGYSRSQSDLEDITIGPVKNTLESKNVALDATCRRVIGIAPTFFASKAWVDNSASLRQTSNSETETGRVGLAYYRPALGSLSVYGEFRKTQFPNRLVLIDGQLEQDGFEATSGGVRYTRRLGARLQGSAFAAYTSLNPDAPGVPGYEGLTYGGALSYKPSSRLSTNIAFARDAEPSNRLDSTYARSESVSVGATYVLGYRMSVSLGGSHARHTQEGVLLDPTLDIVHETTDSVFGSFSMKLNRNVALSLDAAHQQRNADLAGFDYESDRVGLTATANF